MRDFAMPFRGLAKIQEATAPNMIGYRTVGTSLLLTGNIVEGRVHFDRALALYDPAEHRSLATRFGQDVRVAALSWRSMALWLLGYPAAALVDADHALKDAREIGQAITSLYALFWAVAIFLLWRLRNSERVGR
jgi:predicted ATPase